MYFVLEQSLFKQKEGVVGACVMHGLVCGSVSFKIVLARAMLIADYSVCIELSRGDRKIIRMKSITHGS